MKQEIYVINDNGTQIYFVFEKNAKEEANARNRKAKKASIENDVFQNMVKEGIFKDGQEYVNSLNSGDTATETREKNGKGDQTEVKPEQEQPEEKKPEPEQQKPEEEKKEPEQKPENPPANDLKNLLSKIEELTAIVDKMQTENANLKKIADRPRYSLDEILKFNEQKQGFLQRRQVFEGAVKKIQNGLKKLSNVVDYQENNTFRLILFELDHSTNKGNEVFSISVNSVLSDLMNYANSRVMDKLSELNGRIREIDEIFS